MDQLPPGYRFYPTEEELIKFYLRQKLEGRGRNIERVIPVLDIYQYDPWDLPKLSGEVSRRDPQLQEWFFFIPRQETQVRGGRPNRLTSNGYWKATGSPGYVYSSDKRIIGEKRTMVFYQGRAPGGKTEWKMNEYRASVDQANDQASSSSSIALRLEFSVCRVYTKSKCLRSFDRRPSSPGVICRSSRGASTSAAAQQQEALPAANDHQHLHCNNVQLQGAANDQDDQMIMLLPNCSSNDGSHYQLLANPTLTYTVTDHQPTMTPSSHHHQLNSISSICSQSSTSSGDHHVPDISGGREDGPFQMDIDNSPLWEWDPFNWV